MGQADRAAAYAAGAAQMLQTQTVATQGAQGEFTRLRALIAALFPRVDAGCQRWQFGDSLLFRWPGTGQGGALLLMSHQDVVAATGQWRYPPFAGIVADGALWGRGALDVKGNLFCILQAVEELMAAGISPPQDIYIASSHEEETGGNDFIADFLRSQSVAVELLVDEGFAVEQVPGAEGEFALLAVAEKGYLDVKCIARSRGGHAMAPGPGTPLPRLGAFMCQIERDGLLPTEMSAATAAYFDRLSRAISGAAGLRLGHIARQAPGWQTLLDDRQRAMLDTTVAFTMAGGSDAPNVLPAEAYVTCNLRLAPVHSAAQALEALRRVADPLEITLEVLRSNEPSPITDYHSAAFCRVERAIAQVYPGVTVLPFLLSGGTDTKHFTTLCPNCLRFTPLRVTAAQRAAVHGVDEHISVDALPDGVDFFKALITAAAPLN